LHIARSDPAADTLRFQDGTSGIGYRFVLGRKADEDIVRHMALQAVARINIPLMTVLGSIRKGAERL